MDVRSELIENVDPKYRDFHSGLIPGADNILGVRMPVIRDISKKICKDDWRSFLDKPAEYYEETMLRALVIASAKMDTNERLELTRMFMPEIKNWAVCDIFCGDWKVRNGPDKEALWNYCLELLDTDDEFMMRVSSVMMLQHFLNDDHIDDVLRLMTTKHHNGYYYKMGAAWTLSFCYIKFPERTEPALFVETLDKDIRNKAIQKISDSFRVNKEDKERLKVKKKEMS